jgi:hypothetical protein
MRGGMVSAKAAIVKLPESMLKLGEPRRKSAWPWRPQALRARRWPNTRRLLVFGLWSYILIAVFFAYTLMSRPG